MRYLVLCRTALLCCLLISSIARPQVQKIYLSPKAAGNARQSQFVDSVRIIPLEIKEGIELGRFSQTQVTKNYFLITDPLSKVLLVYSKTGSFIKKISYKKLGENLYPSYKEYSEQIEFFGNNRNYSLTSKDQLEIMLDWNNPRNRKYFKKYTIDLNDPSFSIKKEIPTQNDIIRSYQFYNDYYWQGRITTSEVFKDSLDYELKIYKNDQLVKGFFPYNHINEPRFLYTNENTSFTPTDNPNIRFVTRPYCDTVYKMVNDSLFPLYQVVLPVENSLPPSFFTTPFKNKTERENFQRNNGWMLRQIHTFYETPGFIHLMIGYFSNYDSYIYEKQSKITYKVRNIRPDSAQYNLNLLSDHTILRKGDRLYKSQKAGDLVSFFEQHKQVAVPRDLELFLKSNPPASAPVIIEFKYKNQL